MNIIEIKGVSKSYPIYDSPSSRLKELLTFNNATYHKDFWALQDISIEVKRGETFCVVGENGSGKSTLLQMVAGILQPTKGELSVNGRVSALLELGSGFNPEFSGRDNVYLNAAILGLSTKEIDSRYKAIEEFAEIGEFIHHPVRTYSSGMAVRLAFSVAIHVDPEILLVDEALAVGDIYFRQRCMRKVHELRTKGVTILLVSHAIGDVKAVADRVLWLDKGRIREMGTPEIVIAKYLGMMTEKDSAYLELSKPTETKTEFVNAPEVVRTIPNVDHRHGDGRAKVIGIAVFNAQGKPLALLEPDLKIIIRVSAQAEEYVALPNIGFMMRNHLGMDFAGSNTTREGHQLEPMAAGEIRTVDFHVDLPTLYPAHFSFSPAIADGTLENYRMCDWIDNALTLQMGHGEGQVYGYMHLPCRVEVNAKLMESANGN